MNTIVNASARLILALMAFSVFGVAVTTGVFASANEAIARLYVTNVREMGMGEVMLLTLHAEHLSKVMDFFWLSAVLMFGAFLVVYLLARRHHALWFVLLATMFVSNAALDGHFRITRALVDWGGKTAFADAMLPSISAGGDGVSSVGADLGERLSLLGDALGLRERTMDDFGGEISVLRGMLTLIVGFALLVLAVWPLWSFGRDIWWKHFHRHAAPPPLPYVTIEKDVQAGP